MDFGTQPHFHSTHEMTMPYPGLGWNPAFGANPVVPFPVYMHPARMMPADPNAMCEGKTESKPRLSKEEVEKLEKVFQDNSKPSSAVKAALAGQLRLERPRINNWFQNRRAKEKQDKKQREYEASTAAGEAAAETTSSDEQSSRGVSEASSAVNPQPQRQEASSQPFPEPTPACVGKYMPDEDGSGDSDQDNHSYGTQPSQFFDGGLLDEPSPLSSHAVSPAGSFVPAYTFAGQGIDGIDCSGPSPFGEFQANDYTGTGTVNFNLPTFTTTTSEQTTTSMDDGVAPDVMDACYPLKLEPFSVGHDSTGSSNALKSPPPPANIASRRRPHNRPAALQPVSLRSLSHNLGSGPKTAVDSSRPFTSTSPATAMRRISSASGHMSGRIQKHSSVPRSPMFFNRTKQEFRQEVRQQLQAPSPVGRYPASYPSSFPGSFGSAFGSLAPAPSSPMTPAMFSHPRMHEPAMSPVGSDDEAVALGAGGPHWGWTSCPGSPGMMNHTAAYGGYCLDCPRTCQAGLELCQDQPIFTPNLQSEFPAFPLQRVPSNAGFSDGSLPTTPLYSTRNMVLPTNHQDRSPLLGSNLVWNQCNWDVSEPKSFKLPHDHARGMPRQSQIQFAQNITPQNYAGPRA